MSDQSALLKPPPPGEWKEDPTTGDKVFTFVCECPSDCGAVYVGRSQVQFDLSKIHKPSDLKNMQSDASFMLDATLCIAATRLYNPETFNKDFDVARKLTEAVEVYNTFWFMEPE